MNLEDLKKKLPQALRLMTTDQINALNKDFTELHTMIHKEIDSRIK